MADGFKQDAESQRVKPNPAPRDRGNGISEITDKLRDGTVNVDSKTLNDGLVNIAKNIHTFGIQANAKLDSLSVSMSGNKLKELETNKEGIARTDKTNELLGKILKKELVIPDAPKGWWGRIFAIVGGLSGIVAGLVAGFVLGIADSIITATTLMVKAFKNIGKFAKLFSGLFSGNIKVFRSANGAFKSLPLWAKAIQKLGKAFRFTLGIFSKAGKSIAGFKKIGTGFSRAIKSLKSGFLTLKLSAQMIFFSLTMFVDDAKAIATTYKNSAKGIASKLKNGFKSIFKPFNFIIDAFRQAFKPIAAVITTLTTSSKAVGSFGLVAKAFFRPLGTFFKFAFAVFKPIGRLLGKLFFPLTIIMGIFDGVKGAIDGVANNKEGSNFVAGMFGALKGILIGVVGIPLDMLKNAVAWLFEKFGMADVADAIGNFSFSDQIGKLVDGFKSLTTKIIDFFVGMFSIVDFGSGGLLGKAFKGMGDLLKRLVKPMLYALLPDPRDTTASKLVKSLAVKGLNKAGVYGWAGIDSETGFDLIDQPNIKVKANGVNGDDLMTESAEASAAKNGNNKGVNQVEVVNAVTNTQSSNSSVNVTGNVFENRRRGNRGAVFG
tara:strand:+ start:2261 stop:4072 length:1812 start_codon:yes stop_codon:yes gene_type:complete